MSTALAKFREAYDAMIVAAERLRAELDTEAIGDTPGDIRQLQLITARHFRMPLPRLLSDSRDTQTVTARQVAMKLCRDLTRHSLVAIGLAFHKDHGTVINAAHAVETRCATDEVFATLMQALANNAKSALVESVKANLERR